MPAQIYYDQDADLGLLKNKTIAIIGYGSQGHAQAQNLRDSGCNVIIGQRPGSPNYDLAISHGFKPVSAADAAKAGDLVNILLPDEVQGDIYRSDILPNLSPGNVLLCSHGFNIHFSQIVPPKGVDVALVAPKGPGHLVRSEYVKGGAHLPVNRLPWLMPRVWAARVVVFCVQHLPKKPRPISLASRWCCAVA